MRMVSAIDETERRRMKRSLRRIGLGASLAATMALAAAGPALAAGKGQGSPTKSRGQGPKLVTGNPGKGATVIHCKRLAPGANGVIVITPKGKVINNCKGLPATLPGLPPPLQGLPTGVLERLLPTLPPIVPPVPVP